MADLTSERIVNSAIEADDLAGLLLGKPEYRYVPAGSPSPDNTDLSVLLNALYERAGLNNQTGLRLAYEKAIGQALETPNGVGPVAYAVVFEALRNSRGKQSMNLPLDNLAKMLRVAVERHNEHLKSDFSGAGRSWSNGWLGELGRLSSLSEELGGPRFA